MFDRSSERDGECEIFEQRHLADDAGKKRDREDFARILVKHGARTLRGRNRYSSSHPTAGPQ